MNTLILLVVIGIIFLLLSRVIGKIVEAVIGTAAIVVILYAVLRYLRWI